MKPILAILAHQSAQPSLDDFLPRWNALGLDTFCFVPVGDTVTGFERVQQIGESAHSGYKVLRRFLDTLIAIYRIPITQPNRQVIIAEYDTVPLRPILPTYTPNGITCHAVKANPHNGIPGEMQLCLLSPWVTDRWTIGRFIEAGEKELEKDTEAAPFHGLLDRWIGHVCQASGIPVLSGSDMLGYPWHPGAHERIRRMGFNWIHGWKRAADFDELWNQNET